MVQLAALFCFENGSLKDYLLLLGYSSCFSPLQRISQDIKEGKKCLFFFFIGGVFFVSLFVLF